MWFKNRRAKAKREAKEGKLGGSPLPPGALTGPLAGAQHAGMSHLYPSSAFPTPNPSPNTAYRLQAMHAKSDAAGYYPTSAAYSYAPVATAVNDPKVTSGQQMVASHMMQAHAAGVIEAGLIAAPVQPTAAAVADGTVAQLGDLKRVDNAESNDDDSQDYSSTESHVSDNEQTAKDSELPPLTKIHSAGVPMNTVPVSS